MHRTPLSTALTAIFLAACTPPEPAALPPVHVDPPPSPSGSAAPEEARVDGPIVGVVTVRTPAGVVVDGDLHEWGALPAPVASLPTPADGDEIEVDSSRQPSPKLPPPQNPASARSRIAFALNGDGALIAGDLGEAAKEGVWVGVGARVAELPHLGEYFGRMGFVLLDCATMPTVEGEADNQGYRTDPRPPELADACRGLKARRAEAKAKHAARFEKLFKIDRDGVRAVGPGGALVAVEGAKSAWKPGPQGATVEVSLPLAAMPRMAEAPLQTVRLFARVAPSAPAIGSGEWVWLSLVEPASFEPHSELRAHAIRRSLDVGDMNYPGMTTYQQPRAVSYHPADPLHIEFVDSPTCDSATPHEVLLFEKLADYQGMEIGRVAAPRGTRCVTELEPWVALHRKGKVASLFQPAGTPRTTVLRDGELHLLSYEEKSYSAVPGHWSVLAISASGAQSEVTVEPVPGTKEADFVSYWEDATDFLGKDAQTFGWRGTKSGKGLEATWEWDAARKVYKGTQHSIPPSKKRPKKIKRKK